MSEQNKVKCPLLNKEIDWGYCWELCNIATDDILLEGDTVPDWDKALEVCSAVDIQASQKAPDLSPIFSEGKSKGPSVKMRYGRPWSPTEAIVD